MTPAEAIFVDPFERQAANASAKLGRWVKECKVPVTADRGAHDALQRLRSLGPQVLPNLHQALSIKTPDAAAGLALVALDGCIEAMHALLGALPTDTRAFSVVDDLMSLRDLMEARFRTARRHLDAIAEDHTEAMAASGSHRFGR